MKSWIFQGNPDKFRVDDYLSENKEIYWNVNQGMEQMSSGDAVYIWRSIGKKGKRENKPGGIVAKGTIVECSYKMPDYVREYYIEKPEEYFPGVRIIIEDVRLDEAKGMLKRDYFIKDNVFTDLKIIRMSRQANYRLERKHIEHIDQLWEEKKYIQ